MIIGRKIIPNSATQKAQKTKSFKEIFISLKNA
jgi:hypothetical protein